MTFLHLMNKSKVVVFAIALICGGLMFNSCSDDDDNPPPSDPPLATTALYDTLGWFIQGGEGAVEGSGTEMIADPGNPGQQIQAGRLAIRTVVEESLQVIAADTTLQEYFTVLLAELQAETNTGYAELLANFTDFVQQAVSGQQIYEGLSMAEAHNHATYDRFGTEANPVSEEEDFNQFIADVVIAAQSLDVPGSVIAQLGAILATVKDPVTQG